LNIHLYHNVSPGFIWIRGGIDFCWNSTVMVSMVRPRELL
jgi:hypothetical protein